MSGIHSTEVALSVLKCNVKITGLGGWSVIILGKKQVAQLNPPNGCSFRVKGRLDDFPVKFKSLLPRGDGQFMLMINAEMRKGTGKKAGDTLRVSLELDESHKRLSSEFLACLRDEPAAFEFFKTLNKSNQHYFNYWIVSAKTPETRAERIALSVASLAKRQVYTKMRMSLRNLKFEV